MVAQLQSTSSQLDPYLVCAAAGSSRKPQRHSARVVPTQRDAGTRELRRKRDAEEGIRDRDLVRRVRLGEHQALADLYDCHGGMVYSIALSILRDSGRAEDVTQEVFTTLWTEAHRYDPAVGRFAPWLYRIARNRAIDMLRKFRREVLPDELIIFDLLLGPAGDSPSEAVLQRHDALRVRAALREIPDEQRRLLELAYFGGLTQSQMAEELDLPLGTVKTRVRTGLRRLRALLEYA